MVNVVGTTRMLDALADGPLPERIVLASSRAVYGEGAWVDAAGETVYPGQRPHEMLDRGIWDFPGLTPLPVAAAAVEPRPSSVYAATKLAQEHVVRAWCQSLGVRPVVFRLQNVYGSGQSTRNPYTGILPLFARLAAGGTSIPVYEDGQIHRDFVHVDDVASALLGGLTFDGDPADVFDIGSGSPMTIMAIAKMVAAHYEAPPPHVTGQFRDGDVRYACADATKARRVLGWTPEVGLSAGLRELFDWLGQPRERR